MKLYSADKIRNVALLGHSSSGKTTLTEAALYVSGAIKRQGTIDDGNTVSDFSQEEKSRGVSIGTSEIAVEFLDHKINFLDTPGYFDFIGEMYGAKRASESTILLIDAANGIEVGTEKAWSNLEKYNTPRIIFVNKMDREELDYDKIYNELREKLGKKLIPFTLPLEDDGENEFTGFIDIVYDKEYKYADGKSTVTDVSEDVKASYQDLRTELEEKIAETDEVLMEKYFDGEAFSHEETIKGIIASIEAGDLVPVVMGSATEAIGIDYLMERIINLMPSPNDIENPVGKWNGEEITRGKGEDEPFSAVVFKTIVDPFLGKISLFRVHSGYVDNNTKIFNSTKEEDERLNGLFIMRGKEQIEVDRINSGDIGATTRLEHTETGDTICVKDKPIVYETIEYPKPTLFTAIVAKERSDEDKLGTSLRRLQEEDPTFVVERNAETKQLLIGGQGNMQLTVIIEKLKNAFDVNVDTVSPKVAYRETIRGKSDVQGRHKRQSGGAGQFGDVHIRFEPTEEEFVFEEEVFGGAVPRNYFPAVEKGLEESMEFGPLAGYPVVNVKATLYDGSHHPVDSNEMAFKTAATLAFRKGIVEADPVLLEPVMSVHIKVPEDYLGDVMGDMNRRRGRVLGMEQDEEGNQLVNAEAPQSEMFDYAIDLRAMTQSRGEFEMEFLRYEEVPREMAEKIIQESEKED